VVDFGLVKTLAANGGESRTDAITGMPMYLSPEAITTPDAVDERTDIYALGAVAYFLLAGHARIQRRNGGRSIEPSRAAGALVAIHTPAETASLRP